MIKFVRTKSHPGRGIYKFSLGEVYKFFIPEFYKFSAGRRINKVLYRGKSSYPSLANR